MRHLPIALSTASSLLVGLSTVVWALPEDQKQPIHLEASRGQLDQRTGISTYEGNVVISQGTLRLTADTVTVHIKDNNFDRLEATGNPVHMRYKATAEKPEMIGESQRVEYNVTGAKVTLSSGARLTQGKDTFVGDWVDYDLKKDIVLARGAGENGRIQFTIQPQTANGTPTQKKP